jgi:hypothetical protein
MGNIGEGQCQPDSPQSDHPQVPSDSNYGLQLSVELKDTIVRLNSTPQIIVKLKNVGDKPITIYKKLEWGQSKGLSFFIKAISGKLADPTFIPEASYYPPFPKEDFVTIQPGESFEVKRLISLQILGVKEPGDYRLIVRYRSPISEDFAPAGLEIWAKEYGPLQTKPIDLKVAQ